MGLSASSFRPAVFDLSVKRPLWSLVAAALALLSSRSVLSQEISSTAPSPTTDRVLLGASGSTLSAGSGGGGASIGWLHDISGSAIAVAGDYDTQDNAHWEYASLSGVLNVGAADSVFAEVDEGVGTVGLSTGLHHFDYRMEVLGANATLGGKVTAQFETRQINIDTSRGNLPKLSLGYLWSHDWQTTGSYAKSVGGNLGTELAALRVDRLGGRMATLFLGGAVGHVAPPVVNFQPGQTAISPQYREGFLGASKEIAHREWSFVMDYTSLERVRRVTLSVICSLPVGKHGS